MTYRDKRLVDFEQSDWDDLNSSTHVAILNEARVAESDVMMAAVAVLITNEGTEVPCYWSTEYGDGEGTSLVKDFIAAVERRGDLFEGEMLVFRLVPFRVGRL